MLHKRQSHALQYTPCPVLKLHAEKQKPEGSTGAAVLRLTNTARAAVEHRRMLRTTSHWKSATARGLGGRRGERGQSKGVMRSSMVVRHTGQAVSSLLQAVHATLCRHG